MAEYGTSRNDPFSDMFSLVSGPVTAVVRSFDQLRRGSDELLKGLENFNRTMENLNETAARVNRLLNDFEEPVRLMLPQLTRTVKMAEEVSNRLAGPVDQVAPGLSRLAETLDSPVLRALPRDLGQFMEIINDVGRRMSPLAQLAEQAGGMFGIRMPGLGRSSGTAAAQSGADAGHGADEGAEDGEAAAPRTARPATRRAATASTTRSPADTPRKRSNTRTGPSRTASSTTSRAPVKKSTAKRSATTR